MSFAERLGGSEAVLWTLLCNLDRDRFEPVAVFLEPGPFEREVAALGIRTYVVEIGRYREIGRGVAGIRRLARIIRAERPDLIVNFILKAQLYGAPAAVLAGARRRVVWWQHDIPGRQPLDRAATLLPARAVVACSSDMAERQARLRPRRRTVALLAGVSPPRAASPNESSALRRQLGLPEAPIVGIVGRLQEWKGQHRLLEALALLRAEGHPVHGLVVGGTQHGAPPDYERFLQSRTVELGLAGNVTFAGQVADADPYLGLMDVIVNASDPEPYGLVVLESLAAGVPVVAVDAGGPREILDGGRGGVLAPSGSPTDLAGAIAPLLADEALRRDLSERGRERYRERFTVERMMEEIQPALEELARR